MKEKQEKKMLKYDFADEITSQDDRYDFVEQKVFSYEHCEVVQTTILNDNNTGIVLNGIYGRDTSNIYAKPVTEGKSEYALSKEEKEAIEKATK